MKAESTWYPRPHTTTKYDHGFTTLPADWRYRRPLVYVVNRVGELQSRARTPAGQRRRPDMIVPRYLCGSHKTHHFSHERRSIDVNSQKNTLPYHTIP